MAWTSTDILDQGGFTVAVIQWKSPAWADADNTTINITRNHPVFGAIPFTVDPVDNGAGFDTGQLFDAIKAAGAAGTVTIGAYVAPA